MTESDVQKLIQRYLAGRCTPEESQLVEQLYEQLGQANGPEMEQAEQEKLLAAMWQRLESRTRPVPKTVFWPISWQAPALRWAAAALVALGGVGAAGLLLPARSPKTALRRTPAAAGSAAASAAWTVRTNITGQEQTITLPDRSRVVLKPGSSLRYATGFAGPKRAVYFTGDAFFKVSKDPRRPFLVLTKQLVTTVLGTSFRVRALASSPNATVTVREGRVAVQPRAGAHLDSTPDRPASAGVLLLPNQQVVYSGAAQRLRKELAAAPALLTPQALLFDARPVPEVLATLEKAYGVDIEYEHEALAACTVTLDLTNKSLAGKLDVLCQALGATYEESGTRIIFHCKGCRDR